MLLFLSRNYRAWRTFDRELAILNNKISGYVKLPVAPATLVRIFGPPSWYDNILGTSGTFEFEDTNLDVFRIFDRHETKEFLNPKLLKLEHPPHSLRGKTENLPTFHEFWRSNAPVKFWVGHTSYADVEKFLVWAREKIEKNEDVLQKAIEKFGEIEPATDYKKEYQLSKDFALFKYNKIKWD